MVDDRWIAAAVADLLVDKPFLMGEAGSEIVATAYGFLAKHRQAPIVSPVRHAILQRSNPADDLDRIETRYFDQPGTLMPLGRGGL
jgi:hypothetical protein